jgi:hypothetical protein
MTERKKKGCIFTAFFRFYFGKNANFPSPLRQPTDSLSCR